jgi:hypothetical protein
MPDLEIKLQISIHSTSYIKLERSGIIGKEKLSFIPKMVHSVCFVSSYFYNHILKLAPPMHVGPVGSNTRLRVRW